MEGIVTAVEHHSGGGVTLVISVRISSIGCGLSTVGCVRPKRGAKKAYSIPDETATRSGQEVSLSIPTQL